MLWSCNIGQALFWIISPFLLFLHRVNYSEANSRIFRVITGDMYSENVLRWCPISWRTPFLYYRLIRTVGDTINEVIKLARYTVSAKTFPALKSRKPEVLPTRVWSEKQQQHLGACGKTLLQTLSQDLRCNQSARWIKVKCKTLYFKWVASEGCCSADCPLQPQREGT